ncbi:UNVERIFIED_CONTAM: hypothetical protein GTU68_037301 [Idotea baltica]|nr:hypothetical protein [Idotea baltica]
MPKMGESIIEATILKWAKNVGDSVDIDETILEIATDKVDSDIPSPVKGIIAELLYQEDDIVEIGEEIVASPMVAEAPPTVSSAPVAKASAPTTSMPATKPQPMAIDEKSMRPSQTDRFYSPLVRKIAQGEGINLDELDQLPGSGLHGRVTKSDIMAYVTQRKDSNRDMSAVHAAPVAAAPTHTAPAVAGPNEELVEMDRMRMLIADHMVKSVQTSPHVTSFVEADVTNMVNWRNKIKGGFKAKYGQNITFTPLFFEAVIKAIQDFPMINVSVNGKHIVVKKDINIGMAAALPSGNLIVPVIKNADHLNLIGLTQKVNDLAKRARENALKPDEIQGGTFTLTNVGTFGNVMGTPIINQPQVAILATGAIRKKPAVIETEYGDVIAIRQMMFMSLSYDHRVVDGFLGGSFVRRVADYLEAFDPERSIG